MRPILSKLSKLSKYFRKADSSRQGPFLVSLEPKKSWYEKYVENYKEPVKDFTTLVNVVRLFGAGWAYKKAMDTKKIIQMTQSSVAKIEEKMEHHDKLRDDVSKVCQLLEQTTIELKKLNDGVLEIHRQMKVQWEKDKKEA